MSATARRRTIVAAAAAALFFALATPWALRPWLLGHDLLPRDDGPFAAMENADLYLNAWILAWVAHAALTDPAAIFDGNIFYPAHNTIAGSENMIAHLPVTAPALAWTGSALATLKAMAVESFVVAGLGMLALVYRQTRSFPAALFAGAAFAFAPWRVQSFPHPQYLATGFMPLALLAVDAWLERRRLASLVGLAAAVALQLLACLYLSYFLFAGLVAYASVRLLTTAAERRARALLGMIAAAAAGGALAAPILAPYLHARAAGMIPHFDVASFTGHTWAPWNYLSLAFVGFAGVMPVAVVVGDLGARAWRRWRGATTRSNAVAQASIGAGASRDAAAEATADGEGRSVRAGLWAIVGIGVLLSTGPYLTLPGGAAIPTPYLLLYELVPGFSAIRGPRRFFILVLVGLCALAGYALARALRRVPPRTAAVIGTALAAACVIGAAPRPSPVMPAALGAEAPAVYRWLAEQAGGGAVLEIPASAIEGDFVGNLRSARYMLSSTLHWHPLVNGFSGYEPASASFLSAAIRRLPDPQALGLLVDSADVRWIVVHRDRLAGSEIERWRSVSTPGLNPVARFGDDEVYAVTLAPSRAWREQVAAAARGDATTAAFASADASRSLTGLPTAPLAPECRSAEILAVDVPPVVALTAFPVPIPVRIANRSTCAWPALAVPPNGLVGLSYRWRRPDGEDLPRGPFSRLLADVPAGETASSEVVVIPPFGDPGTWTLEVFLEQHGTPEPLARASVPVEVERMRADPAPSVPKVGSSQPVVQGS